MYDEASDTQYKMKVLKFVIQTMITFNQELVEKSDLKGQLELQMCARVKDGVRMHGIQTIVQSLDQIVLQNHT